VPHGTEPAHHLVLGEIDQALRLGSRDEHARRYVELDSVELAHAGEVRGRTVLQSPPQDFEESALMVRSQFLGQV